MDEALREDRPEEEGESDSGELDFAEDSNKKPSFDIMEETQMAFSMISLKKSGVRRTRGDDAGSGSETDKEEPEIEITKLDEKDEKCFEKVEQLIKGGLLEKLKIDQCKIYLRKYGLRLNGNKGVLLARIREHQEVIDGGGEKKYPPENFVLNCKGDACMGDVVMFEQNVYDMYSVVSRSATGPPCGTRTVAGRIVKESYGACKQQHTFTIEVLWSKGVKPLPPLHPLLIKGRNLYRLKTVRQRWTDEGERRKVLQEKHVRGFIARSSRETRIQEKEMKKKGILKKRNKAKGDSTVSNKGKQGQEKQHRAHHIQQNENQIPKESQYVHGIRSNLVEQAAILERQQWASNYKKPKIAEHRAFQALKPWNLEHRASSSQYPHYFSKQHYPWNDSYHPHYTNQNQHYIFFQTQPCHLYHQGRCHYGENCRYLHYG